MKDPAIRKRALVYTRSACRIQTESGSEQLRDLSRISRDAVKLNALLRFARDNNVAVVAVDGGCPSPTSRTEVRVRLATVPAGVQESEGS